jgi:hypothetical protein
MSYSDIRMFRVAEFYVRFEVLPAITRHITVFLNVVARGLLDSYQSLE